MNTLIEIAIGAVIGFIISFTGLTINEQRTEAQITLGAPTTQLTYQKTLIPITDSLYDLGTSTQAWRNAYIDQICLNGDCETAWPSGAGGAYPFTPTLNYAVDNSATSTPIWARLGINASTTSHFVYASTTALNATSLCLDGDVCRTTWPTAGSDFPFTPTSYGNSTSTTIGFLNGLLSTASSTIGNGTQAGGLTISGGATTTGNGYFASNVCIGTENCSGADLTISSAASFQSPISNATIHVVGANNQSVRAVFDSNNASNAFGTLIQGRRSRGPAASPSAVTGGDVLLQLAGAGYGTSEYVSSNGSKGIIAIKGDATWTNTNSPARIEFFTVPDSSVTNALRFTIGKAGQWGIGGTASQVASDADFGDSGEGFLSQGAGAAPAWVDVWTEAENTTAAYVPGSRQLTVAGTANQLTSSAGAQDLSADRTWTLSLPNHVIFPSSYQATNGSTTNATSTSLNVSGQVDFDGLTSALIVTGAGGILAEYAGASCTNQFVRSLDALGAATCASVANTDLTNSSITINGTSVSLGGSITVASTTLLANFNTWTGGNSFGHATSTLSFTFPVGTSVNSLVAGQAVIDSSNGQFRYHDGIAARNLIATSSPSFRLASTTLDDAGLIFKNATSTYTMKNSGDPKTLLGWYCDTFPSGTAIVRFGDGTNYTNEVACTGTGAYTVATTNNTFTAFEPFVVQASSTAGTVSVIVLTPHFHETAQ